MRPPRRKSAVSRRSVLGRSGAPSNGGYEKNAGGRPLERPGRLELIHHAVSAGEMDSCAIHAAASRYHSDGRPKVGGNAPERREDRMGFLLENAIGLTSDEELWVIRLRYLSVFADFSSAILRYA